MMAWTRDDYLTCLMNVTDVVQCKNAESLEQGCDITDEEDDKAFWNLLEIQNEVSKIVFQFYLTSSYVSTSGKHAYFNSSSLTRDGT